MSRIPEPENPPRISDATLARSVTGVGLSPGTLADQIVAGRMLLVFLRHFGCMFCRETIADIRKAAESNPDYPAVLFFFQGSATEGRAFLRRYWPGARAVADPELELYGRLRRWPRELARSPWAEGTPGSRSGEVQGALEWNSVR